MMWLLLIVISALWSAPALAVDRIVDITLASDCTSNNYDVVARTCTGSWGNAYNTVQEVLDIVSPGDNVWLRAGTVYTLRVADNTQRHGTPSNRITIEGCPASVCGTDERPIFRPTANFVWDNGAGDNYYTYRRLELDGINANPGCTEGSNSSMVLMQGTGVTLDDVWLKNARCTVFGSHKGANLTIKNSWIYNWSSGGGNNNGLYISGDGWLVENNLFEKASGAVISNALWINGASGGGANGIARYNYFKGQASGGWITLNEANISVYGNIANGGKFIQTGYNATSACIGASPACGTGGQFYGNTLYDAEGDAVIDFDSFGGVGSTNTFSGNIVVCKTTGTKPYKIDESGSTGNVITNNTFRNCGTGTDNGTGTTISGNVTTDPLLEDPATLKFRLQSGSPAINNGGTSPFKTCNGAACEQGAYETWGVSPTATIDTTIMDVTLPHNVAAALPLTPAAGITGFSVSCSGTDCGTPVVASAALKEGSDNIVRLNITGIGGTGNCLAAQVWTWSYTPGNLLDGLIIGRRHVADVVNGQPLFTASSQPVTEVCTGSPPTPPAGNLEVHYELDDGTGTNANDETVNARDGTLTNGATFDASGGKYGGAVLINGNDDYVAVPYGSAIDPTATSVTVAFGYFPSAGTESNTRTFAGIPFVSGERFFITRSSTGWKFAIKDVALGASSEFPVSAGWTHVCVELDAATDTGTLFINGVAGTTEGSSKITSYGSFSFGGNFAFGAVPSFNTSLAPIGGRFDRFKWWSAVTRCVDEYAAWEPPPPPPSGGNYEQKGHRVQAVKLDPSTAIINLTAIDGDGKIGLNGAFALVTQLDCTGGACPQIQPRVRYSKNGGGFNLQVPDNPGPDGIAFLGNIVETNLNNANLAACIKGALPCTLGPTAMVGSAIPTVSLSTNESFIIRHLFRLHPGAVAGDRFCLEVYDQNGAVLPGGYTPAGGACIDVVTNNANSP